MKSVTRSARKTAISAATNNDARENANAVVMPSVEAAARLAVSRGWTWYPEAEMNLERWLGRMAAGSKDDFRTPFFKEMSRVQVQTMFKNHFYRNLGVLDGVPIPGYRETWLSIEQGEEVRCAPQSMYLPWLQDGPEKVHEVMSDKPLTSAVNSQAYAASLEFVASLLPAGRIRHIDPNQVVKVVKGLDVQRSNVELDPTTNSCFPTYAGHWAQQSRLKSNAPDFAEYRWYAVHEPVRRATVLWKIAARSPNWRDIPCSWVGTVGQRTNPGKDMTPLVKDPDGKWKKVKRVVIGLDKTETVFGKTIMAVLQPALAKVVFPGTDIPIIPAWQPLPSLDKAMQAVLELAQSHRLPTLSGDISGFDKSVPPQVIWDVAQSVARWFEPETARGFLAHMHAFVYDTAVISPSQIVSPCPSSVKSGSIYTSLIGCLVNLFLIMYGSFAGYYHILYVGVMGDDFVVVGPDVTPDSISKAFSDFNMLAHPDKQLFEMNILHFLQRLHVLGYPGGQGSLFRIGGNCLSVEDDKQLKGEEAGNPYAYIVQALARLENSVFNPEAERLIQLMASGDQRYHLGANMSTSEIVGRAGEYGKRRLMRDDTKTWDVAASGVPFDSWAVNRVLRGDKLPPPGKDRFKAVYGIPYEKVRLIANL